VRLFGTVEVDGLSMAPTFIPGDQLYVRWYSRKGAKASALAAGNIVILERDEQPGVFYIKRITQIAAEGIWVQSDNPKGTDSTKWGWLPPHTVKAKYLFRTRKAKREN
jgi:phage repressor protein C with HTH and peptisase S24 domain